MEERNFVERNAATFRRMLFATSFLPNDIPNHWDIVARFGSEGSSRVLLPDKARQIMENTKVLTPMAFSSDKELALELIALECGPNREALGIPLVPDQTKCNACTGNLLIRSDRPSRLTIYTDSLGTVPATHYHKYCRNQHRGCNFVQYYGYYKTSTGILQYNSNWMSLPYFISSQETGFEMAMLKLFDSELLLGQLSYKQKADTYNVSKGYDTTRKICTTIQKGQTPCQPAVHGAHPRRQEMDRRRFEAAHIKYACLQMSGKYPDVLLMSSIQVEHDTENILAKLTPPLFKCFEANYAAHRCSFPGCGSVLVLDGNQKNQRDICFAKDAVFIEFDGLPGSIKTGCQATPAFKNRYCVRHKNNACELLRFDEADEELGTPSGPELRAKSRTTENSNGSPIAEMILSKKTTRKHTYYQVLWVGLPECFATWEPAQSLSPALVQSFEEGNKGESTIETHHFYGHISSTINVNNEMVSEPLMKKKKKDRLTPDISGGAFQDNHDHLSCRTEKDRRNRLNHRTAGVLARIWPCGVITLIRELFLSESKSQVYGHLYDFLRNLPETASHLKYICYNDGCHLKKYALNPIRCDLTETTKVLSKVTIAVDKMHMAGHIDPWCKKECDPHLYAELKMVDTEACEQLFSWLSRYSRITHKMNRDTFLFFLLYICDLHNTREVHKLKRADYM